MTLNLSATTHSTPSPLGAPDAAMTFAFGTTSLGQVLVAATEKGVSAIFLGSDQGRLLADLIRHFPKARISEGNDRLADTVGKVVALIEDPASPVDLTLDLQGSDFEITVWQALRAIPPGKTLSYSELAARLGVTGGEKGPAKEVADACANNRIAVAVPCHRILRKDGTISGYRWGVHRKRALLKREGVQ
ncbi:methylated-DNA--[protein]-cysteine S-methyltransferase [Taklimakanibacter deserti]|uniref:methylated-DNA--[protein]-cysteine S-methyltransferase n=1 Tax=Taklimakanibacter deserti TaxID=2267839 RepID=UPI000E6467BE